MPSLQAARFDWVMLDRPGLETHVCERYDVVKKESERFFSDLNIQHHAGKETHCVP